MTKHFYVPDVQAKPGDDFTFLTKIGEYIVAKQPDVVICGGDFADMPSLSSYDIGKKDYEGRRYRDDVNAARDAMYALLKPIIEYNERQRKNGKKQYKPRMIMTLGNHEARIDKAVNNDPKLEGILSVDDLGYELAGWEVYPFLEVVIIDGIAYSHYFVTGLAGRPAATANAQLNKNHQSCIAGHQQGLQIAMGKKADGSRITSIIAGSCYEHNEDYLGAQGNKHWRGCLMLHSVNSGEFDLVSVPLHYLNSRT